MDKEEQAELIALTQKGCPGARKIKRANILLLADAGKPDFEIAELLHTSWLTVLRTRYKFVGRNSCCDRTVFRSQIGWRSNRTSEVCAWESERIAARATVNWRFKIPNARYKLKKLYPVIEE